MTDFNRFAVYAAPEPGPLAAFAADWLGWDPAAGERRSHPEVPGLPLPVADLTAAPRKYGFHGTLKPPFRLTTSRAALEADLGAFATANAPVVLDGLRLARIGRFLALVPEGDTSGLGALASGVVQALDTHRAPPSEAELARRRAAGLSARQEALLTAWGYPYVLEEFRFHFTLTGPLDPDMQAAAAAALDPVLAPLLPRPFVIRDLCLFGEDAEGMFHILHRYALTG
jgi:putative phosphonate metabolism protein